ncbi:MAG TPA: hypothetical protein VIT45_00710 [Allosphingosinicella sp.]
MLIALIAVATQIIPVVQSAWHQPEADVAYAVQTVDLRRMTVMAANDGDRSGAVSSGLLKINGNVRAGLRLMNGGGIVLLPPHSTAILNFIAEPNTPYDYRNREKDVCAIALPVTDQEGVRNFEDRTVDCEYLKVMLTAIRRAGGRQ